MEGFAQILVVFPERFFRLLELKDTLEVFAVLVVVARRYLVVVLLHLLLELGQIGYVSLQTIYCLIPLLEV